MAEEGKIILYSFSILCIIVGIGIIAGLRVPIAIGAGLSFIIVGILLIIIVAYLPIQDSPSN
jgi:hypothetical protein